MHRNATLRSSTVHTIISNNTTDMLWGKWEGSTMLQNDTEIDNSASNSGSVVAPLSNSEVRINPSAVSGSRGIQRRQTGNIQTVCIRVILSVVECLQAGCGLCYCSCGFLSKVLVSAKCTYLSSVLLNGRLYVFIDTQRRFIVSSDGQKTSTPHVGLLSSPTAKQTNAES